MIAQQLVNLIRILGENRSRQKRRLLKCIPQWTDLINQVSFTNLVNNMGLKRSLDQANATPFSRRPG